MLFNIPFGAVQLVATMGGAWLATVWKMKGPVLALLCLPPIAGCVMLLQITHDNARKGPLLAGYYIVRITSKWKHERGNNTNQSYPDLCVPSYQ